MKTGAKGQRFSHEVSMCFPETHEVSRLSRSLPCWRCPPWWSCWRPKALQLLCLLGNRCLHLATATTAANAISQDIRRHQKITQETWHFDRQTAYLFASSTAQALVIQAHRSWRSWFAKHVTNRTKCSEAVCGTLVHTWNENIAKKMQNKTRSKILLLGYRNLQIAYGIFCRYERMENLFPNNKQE